MIKDILKDITTLSEDNEELNTENYIDSLNYLDNIYKILLSLQKFVSIQDLVFLPSFKSSSIAERLSIPTTAEENEMKYFIVKSDLFLGKDLEKSIEYEFKDICNKLECKGNTFYFTLK